MNKSLKIGVIGVGIQGETHIKSFQSFHNARVVAIADIDGDKASRVAAQYHIPQWFTDYRQMLKETELDAVSIVVPDHLHKEPALACLNAGKHILLEKPLATNLQDAQAIAQAAKKTKIKFMVNFSNRWQVPLAMAKEALQKGELGYPIYAHSRLSNTLYVPTKMLSWASQTALPHWLMSHTVDRIRWLFGCEAKTVYALSYSGVLKSLGLDTPDLYHATLQFETGALATLESCWILPQTMPSVVDSKLHLICSQGAIFFDPQATVFQKATQTSYTLPVTLQTSIFDRPVGFVTEALRHFVECVLEDKEPMVSIDDALAVTKICCAIVESAKTKKVVEIQ